MKRWLLLCCLALALPAVDLADGVHRLQSDQTMPAALAGTWLRLSDQASLTIEADQSLADLQAGAYARDDQQLLLLQDEPGAAGVAQALVGLGAYPLLPKDGMVEMARRGEALTPLSLPVLVWRLADDAAWPWVDHPGLMGGLAGLCRQYNPDRARGFRFDPDQSCYVDWAGRPVQIDDAAPTTVPRALDRSLDEDPISIARGDLVAGVQDGEALGRSGILVADLGIQGIFDPNDLVVSADAPFGEHAQAVDRYAVGRLFGPVPIFVYQRDPERLAALRAARYRPDNPIWDLPREKQLLTLAGMVILIVTLMRFGRKYKKRRAGKR